VTGAQYPIAALTVTGNLETLVSESAKARELHGRRIDYRAIGLLKTMNENRFVRKRSPPGIDPVRAFLNSSFKIYSDRLNGEIRAGFALSFSAFSFAMAQHVLGGDVVHSAKFKE